MRVLFASTRGAGHFNPLEPFIEACVRNGHEVLVAGPPPLAPAVEAAGYPFRMGAAPPEDELGAAWARVPTVSPDEQNAIVVGEIFARLNVRAMLPHLRAVCEDWRPDVLLRDPAEYASAVAAELAGIAQVRIGVGLASGEELGLDLAAPKLAMARASVGLEPDPEGERIRESPYFTVFPASLDDPPIAGTRRFRDPAADAPSHPLPNWWPDAEPPLVYVTFGSVTAGMPFAAAVYGAAIEAVADLPVRVLMTVGQERDPDGFGALPSHVHAERWVPQAAARIADEMRALPPVDEAIAALPA